MALIIPHSSQTGIAVASGGRAASPVSASAFMTPGQSAMPGALEHLSRGIDKLGGAVNAYLLRERQEQNELELLEDMQKLQAESQAWTDAYQQQYQSKEAMNAEADAQAFYKEKIDPLRKKWEGNNQAQLYLQRHAGELALSGVNAMRDYRRRQQEKWKDSTFAGEEARYKAVMADPRSTPEQKQSEWRNFSGKNVAYLRSKGLDPTAARIQTDRVYRDAVNEKMQQDFLTKVNNNDIEGAKRDLAMMRGDVPEVTDDNIKDVVAAYVDHPNVRSFLNFIAASEGTAGRGDDGYNILFGGSTFDDYGKHPGVRSEFTQTDGRKNTTTAAGRYQFLSRTYDEAASRLDLTDMSPRSQDLAALYLIARRGAFKDVIEGNADAAIEKLGKEWASLPSSPYAQPKHSGQSASAMLEAAGFTKGGLVGPEKIASYEKMLHAATADAIYQSMRQDLQGLPQEEQDIAVSEWLNGIDDKEVRAKLKSRYSADRSMETMRQNAVDMQRCKQFDQYLKEQNALPSHALSLIDRLPDLSDAARERLRKKYTGELNRENPRNRAKAGELYSLIDQGKVETQEQIDAFAFDNALTDKQLSRAESYMKDGGNAGRLSYSKVKTVYRALSGGKNLDDKPEYFEQVKEMLEPGRAPTEQHIRKIVANIIMDGERQGGSIFGYGKDMTHGEAIRKGVADTWLPDVKSGSDEEREIKEELKKLNIELAGGDRDEIIIREHKRIRKMGLSPLPAKESK